MHQHRLSAYLIWFCIARYRIIDNMFVTTFACYSQNARLPDPLKFCLHCAGIHYCIKHCFYLAVHGRCIKLHKVDRWQARGLSLVLSSTAVRIFILCGARFDCAKRSINHAPGNLCMQNDICVSRWARIYFIPAILISGYRTDGDGGIFVSKLFVELVGGWVCWSSTLSIGAHIVTTNCHLSVFRSPGQDLCKSKSRRVIEEGYMHQGKVSTLLI